MNIGTYLKTFRKNNRLSQEELGKMIGISAPTLSNWEAGKYLPRGAKTIASLESALGIERGTLYLLLYGDK